jgi:hypothetical protein
VAQVARPRLLVAGLDVAPREVLHVPQQLVQGGPPSGRDVEHLAADPLGVHRKQVAVDDVPNIGGVARLLSVAENFRRHAIQKRGDEVGITYRESGSWRDPNTLK